MFTLEMRETFSSVSFEETLFAVLNKKNSFPSIIDLEIKWQIPTSFSLPFTKTRFSESSFSFSLNTVFVFCFVQIKRVIYNSTLLFEQKQNTKTVLRLKEKELSENLVLVEGREKEVGICHLISKPNIEGKLFFLLRTANKVF